MQCCLLLWKYSFLQHNFWNFISLTVCLITILTETHRCILKYFSSVSLENLHLQNISILNTAVKLSSSAEPFSLFIYMVEHDINSWTVIAHLSPVINSLFTISTAPPKSWCHCIIHTWIVFQGTTLQTWIIIDHLFPLHWEYSGPVWQLSIVCSVWYCCVLIATQRDKISCFLSDRLHASSWNSNSWMNGSLLSLRVMRVLYLSWESWERLKTCYEYLPFHWKFLHPPSVQVLSIL